MEFNLPPFFYEIFDASLPRLGPGNIESTRKALTIALSGLAEKGPDANELEILDYGSGNGAPTMVLAEQLNGRILAIDNHQPYLNELRRRAEAKHVSDRIITRLADMNKLELENESFDLIWSEGAFFVMGIAEALTLLHPTLKKGGVLVFSDLVWLKEDIPQECRDYLEQICPTLFNIESVLRLSKDIGYEIIDHFTLPKTAWLDHFYNPLEAHLKSLRSGVASDSDKTGLLDSVQHEIDQYRNYSEFYGYEFFIMKKP